MKIYRDDRFRAEIWNGVGVDVTFRDSCTLSISTLSNGFCELVFESPEEALEWLGEVRELILRQRREERQDR